MRYTLLLICFLVLMAGGGFAQSVVPNGEGAPVGDTIPVIGEIPADSIVKQDLAKNAEYFSKGLEEKYNENFPVAIYNFEQALRFFKDDDASMYELSVLYQMAGKNAEAYSMIEQATKLKPDNKWYQIRLAQFHLQNSDYQAFMDIYDKLLEDEPDNLEYLETYIDMLLRIGDYDKVIEKLDVLEEQIGENEYISLQKIEIYKEQGNKAKIVEELEHLVSFMPDNTRYMAMLAEIYMHNKQQKEAYNLYLKIKEIEPENQYINVSLMDYYQSVGELDKAFEEFVAAINNKNLDYETKVQIYDIWFQKIDENNQEISNEAEAAGNAFLQTHPDKAMGYYILGTVRFNNEQYEDAKSYYLQALECDKNSFITLYQLSLVYMQLNDYQGLIKQTETAMSVYPEQPIFYLFNGIGYFNINDYEKTVQVLEKGRKLSANKELTVNFDTYIGDTYNILQNKQKSYEAYDRVLRADPDNIYVLNNYAYYLSLDNEDIERALQMSGKTIKAEPHNPTYLDTYAWVLYKMGRYQEAKKYMEKVFKYDKNPQGINYEHYGDILFQLGDKKNALKNWKKAKKMGDTSEFLDQKIKDEKLYE